MNVPIEIVFKNVYKTPEVEELIRTKAAKLEQICDYMSSCRVVVEQPQKQHENSNPYRMRMRIDMTVPPGHELVAKREATQGNGHDPLIGVIRKTFDAAAKQLQTLTAKQHRLVKIHPTQEANAIIGILFRDDGYGFLRTINGREIYFHRNSILHNNFDDLKIGMAVRFVEEQGAKGPQATSVQVEERLGAAFARP
ncbi:MAG: HPF/RaiA family ribosome-associated protein [Phycisphaerae bacterium]|nr:HPF/RaiA family ribosome-associated protein [Phycisphaerae bacterium]